jgi:hypothetical protein
MCKVHKPSDSKCYGINSFSVQSIFLLGPGLYLLYINDLPTTLYSTTATFADDTAVMAVGESNENSTIKSLSGPRNGELNSTNPNRSISNSEKCIGYLDASLSCPFTTNLSCINKFYDQYGVMVFSFGAGQ